MALAGSGSGSGSGRSGGSGHPPVVLAAERDMIGDDNGWNMGKSDPNYFESKLKYLECNKYVYIYIIIYIHGYNGMYWNEIPKYYLFHLHYTAE